MNKIHVLLLKAFIRPFIVTFFIVMFVLLMLFLFKYIDDLIGKGFEWYTIMELLWYASATQISMALPLSMLLSSIMTFGNLGESYELVAIKAAGISLRKAMMPLYIVVTVFSISAFLFSDYILPIANLKMGSLLWDVRNKKADFLIKDGIFNSSIPGYSIRARDKSKDGYHLYNMMIYEHKTGGAAGMGVILAKEGEMYNSADNKYMILKLRNGVRYEETSDGKVYNPRQRFTRYYFKETQQKFDMSSFQMQHTDEELFKNHYAMLNLKQLSFYTDSVTKLNDSSRHTVFNAISSYYQVYHPYNRPNSVQKKPLRPVVYQNSLAEVIPVHQKMNVYNQALNQARYIKDELRMKSTVDSDYSLSIRRYIMEYHRKFTLAVSCLLLFSIGAPLGAIIRKGGLGLPVVMAIIFFLIYHIIYTVSEKSAKEGSISPSWGMWTAIIVLTPLAIFLIYKAATDSALFDAELYKTKLRQAGQFIIKLFRSAQKNKQIPAKVP
ncbi:lipopolysaccharide export system permease protein [bacterium A37T11]|nr:lipopolysaccharide export system permease protein [bacterium A37T11]